MHEYYFVQKIKFVVRSGLPSAYVMHSCCLLEFERLIPTNKVKDESSSKLFLFGHNQTKLLYSCLHFIQTVSSAPLNCSLV